MRHLITKERGKRVIRNGTVVSNMNHSKSAHLSVGLMLKHAEARQLHRNIITYLKRRNYKAAPEAMQ